jgi:SAM-dependent methyltransferase
MGVFGWFRGGKRLLPVGRSSWELTSRPSDTSLPENGWRRHLPQVPYLLPKDMLETQRMDFQFYLIRSILHGNHASPLRSDVASILDVGCGTGRWVIEMARTFPGAQVVGLDIEPPQSGQILPPNARFVLENLLNGLPFADRSFDFTHQRLMVLAIPAAHWPTVVGDLVRVTRPGGWVELLEGGDVFLNAGPAAQRFLAWWREASRTRGFDASLMERLGRLLLDTRLRGVQMRTLQVPVGKWGGHTGALLEKNMLAGFPALKPLLCTQLSLSPQEFDATLAELAEEGDRYQTSYQYYLAYGQR